jgi:NAD(P)-dependent dehydrogenase (short-subunit alcohol dehydrogenase family)
MSDPFRGRVAVITGGAGGIGFAMAEAFAARGAKIVLADLDEAAMDARAKTLRERGAEVLCVVTDVTKRDSVNALADRVFQHFGAAHLVCNNAGIAIAGPLLQMTPDDWRLTMDIDFWGVVHGVEAFAPRMVEQKQGGHILNTASMAGLVGMSWLGVYCAAKFAVVGFTEALKRELEAHGIGVSVLCPMIVATDITANSMKMRAASVGAADARSEPQASEGSRAEGARSQLEVPKAEAEPDQPPAGALKGGVITTAEVAKRVVRGIERKDLYILTHPEQREFLRRRAARLDEVFEPSRWEI